MNIKIRNRLGQSKRRIERRLDKNDNSGCERPMLTASNIHYEIADRSRGIAAGGMGAMHLVAKKLGLAEAIDRQLHLLKIHLPDLESDHVLNIACNLLAGGACLEHLELRRNDTEHRKANAAAAGLRDVSQCFHSDACANHSRNATGLWFDSPLGLRNMCINDKSKTLALRRIL